MSIKKDLKKEGIEIISKIDTLTVNSLAKKVVDILSKTFPNLNLNTNELFINISRLNMYFAKLPKGISAKYFYKNQSIYFSNNINIDNLADVAIHECIHYLQEKRDKNGNIIRLGLCNYTSDNLPGIGLNEAAVQLMAAKCVANEYENVKYFDINLTTNTPNYYPLECALVNQMSYLIGENILFDSTINSNNNFNDQFISLTSSKVFYTIQKNIDLLVDTQANLENIYFEIENSNKDKYSVQKIEKQKEKIKKLFLETQKLILTSYFDSAINLTYTPKSIENYRNKLYSFKNLIGQVDFDTFFNDYYIDKMMELEKRYDLREEEIKDLVVVKHNFIATLIRKLKLLFRINPDYVKITNRN